MCAYMGQTLRIDCGEGGVQGNQNADSIKPTAMLDPTRNINLEDNGRRKRGGTSHVYATAPTNAPAGRGIFQFRHPNGTDYIIEAWADGTVNYNSNVSMAKSLSSGNYMCITAASDYVAIADGANIPRWWCVSNAVASVFVSFATDWSTTAPFQLLKRGVGNAERLLAVTPPAIYWSAGDASYNFSDADCVKMVVDTGDAGLTGAYQRGADVFATSKTQTYRLDDSNATVTNWGYAKTQWQGGAAHWRVIAQSPNDTFCMMEDGEIYSVTSVEQYGDYKAASITRPSWMHKWIKDHVLLSSIAQFHMTYDHELRALRVWVVTGSNTSPDTCLLFYIDRKPDEAWTIHSNDISDSGYKASASTLVRESVGLWKVYTQDNEGFVWKLEQTTRADNGVAYNGVFKTAQISCEDERQDKRFDTLNIVAEPESSGTTVSVKSIVDGIPKATKTVDLTGGGAVLGSFILSTSTLGGEQVIDKNMNLGWVGRRIQFEVYNAAVNKDFFISELLLDFMPLGANEE
jgi:hypothetical protein